MFDTTLIWVVLSMPGPVSEIGLSSLHKSNTYNFTGRMDRPEDLQNISSASDVSRISCKDV